MSKQNQMFFTVATWLVTDSLGLMPLESTHPKSHAAK